LAPLPPENFTSPIEEVPDPPETPDELLFATVLPPFAKTVELELNQESPPPFELFVLPAPTVTVYVVPGTTVKEFFLA
jgi:hypothetical protein